MHICNFRVTVRVGEYNQSNPKLDCADNVCAPKKQDISITTVIPHERYDLDDKKQNDIALIRLQKHAAMGRKFDL
jgi:hypothetical protein